MDIASALRASIAGGGFDLREMTDRILVMQASGRIGAEEAASIVAEAQDKARPEDSLPNVADRIAALELRVAALEALAAPEDPEAQPGVLEWEQPTGAHDAYGVGDRVVWDGKVWESTVDGNVWDPCTYPQGWQLVED